MRPGLRKGPWLDSSAKESISFSHRPHASTRQQKMPYLDPKARLSQTVQGFATPQAHGSTSQQKNALFGPQGTFKVLRLPRPVKGTTPLEGAKPVWSKRACTDAFDIPFTITGSGLQWRGLHAPSRSVGTRTHHLVQTVLGSDGARWRASKDIPFTINGSGFRWHGLQAPCRSGPASLICCFSPVPKPSSKRI